MNTDRYINGLKRKARKKKKASFSVSHRQALDTIARDQGFTNWSDLSANHKSRSIRAVVFR